MFTVHMQPLGLNIFGRLLIGLCLSLQICLFFLFGSFNLIGLEIKLVFTLPR